MPEDSIKEGSAVAIRCAHGDTVLYPMADVTMEVDGKEMTVEAAVSDTLPMSALLGTDVPELGELLATEDRIEGEEAFAVITRSEAKKQKEEMKENERECEDQPNSLQEDSTTWMDHFMMNYLEKVRKRLKRPKVRREQKDFNENNYSWMKKINNLMRRRIMTSINMN